MKNLWKLDYPPQDPEQHWRWIVKLPKVLHLDNEFSQAGNAYHITHYASMNLVWQVRKRLSLGLEGLYGFKEEKSGADGDAFRIQLGAVYSIFD